MGRYVPPDVEGTTSANKLAGKHALGSRASKLKSQGILTVRFEMPFAVWCSTCPKPTIIGQGVRFNAEKKKTGNYHSTPIWSFRMKHAACGGVIEIRTDPQNTAYVVTEGGRKRDTGDENKEGDIVIITDQEREALRNDSFAKLEKTIADREQLAHAKLRIEEIEDANRRAWEDPYERNRILRKEFRIGRHTREREGKAAEDLKDRMSLGIHLVPECEVDAKRAALVDFGSAEKNGESQALSKPLFTTTTTTKMPSVAATNGKKRLKSEVAASQMRESLVSEIMGNTRVARDPFLVTDRSNTAPKMPARLPGIKRKRETEPDESEETRAELLRQQPTKNTISSAALVNYDSDSA